MLANKSYFLLELVDWVIILKAAAIRRTPKSLLAA
jgi:hypothetical protein